MTTSWNAFDPWQFPGSVKLPAKNSHSTKFLVFMTRVKKASWENADVLPSQRGSYKLARTGRVKHRPGCFVQDVALGVSLAKCQRLGGRTAKAKQNQNNVTLGGVRQHAWKNSFFTHLVLIASRGQRKVFVMKINSCYSRLSQKGSGDVHTRRSGIPAYPFCVPSPYTTA